MPAHVYQYGFSAFKSIALACLLLINATVSAEAPAASSQAPRVTLETDLGNITLELYAEKAPVTVANFLQYCRDNFYTGTIFHRVIPNFVVQGGGMTFDYVKKETREQIVNEASNGLKNTRGTVAMARLPSGADTATSQFFINLNNNRHLNPTDKNPGYAVFGRVVEGMDVADKMTAEPQGKYRPQSPDLPIRILKVTIHP